MGIDWYSLYIDAMRIISVAVALYYVPYLIKRGWETGKLHGAMNVSNYINTMVERKLADKLGKDDKKEDAPKIGPTQSV